MKKKIVNVLLSAAVVAAMMFCVTACGSKTNDVQDTEVSLGNPVTDEQESGDTDGAHDMNADVDDEVVDDMDDEDTTAEEIIQPVGASEGSIALEEWINSEECAQFSEMMNAGLEGMEISFEVDGDTISMIFTMTDAVDVAEGAEDAMSAYFTSNAEIFEAIRDQLISETGNANTVLSLVYRNVDDSEIFSMDF